MKNLLLRNSRDRICQWAPLGLAVAGWLGLMGSTSAGWFPRPAGDVGTPQEVEQDESTQETAAEKDELKEFRNGLGGYSVQQFPNPEENAVDVDLPETNDEGETVGSRKIKVHMHISQSTDFAVAMVTAYHDLPDAPTTKAAIKKVLDGAVLGAVNSVKGTPSDHVEIQIDDFPGRQVQYKASRFGADLQGVSRIYLRGNRVYQSNYIATLERFNAEEAKKFFDSFQLIEIEKE